MFPFQYLTILSYILPLHSTKEQLSLTLLEPEGHKMAIKLGEAYQTEWSQLTVEDWMTIHLGLAKSSSLSLTLTNITLHFIVVLTDKCPTQYYTWPLYK